MKHDDSVRSFGENAALKALIAEDNPGFRLALEGLLKRWGYDAIAAVNGKQALEILTGDDPPRLAVLDWMMPELDGVEVCRRVREQNREPYIYILLLTAKDTAEELIEGMEAGADEYLRKPVNDARTARSLARESPHHRPPGRTRTRPRAAAPAGQPRLLDRILPTQRHV